MNKFLVAIGFMVVYAVAFELVYQYGPHANRSAFFWLGLVFAVLCIYTFFYAGSRRILFTSVFSYGQLLFVAVPVVLIGAGQSDLRSSLRPSAALLFLTLFFAAQIVILILSDPLDGIRSSKLEVDASVQVFALGLFAVSLSATFLMPPSNLTDQIESLSLASIVLSSFVVFTRSTIRALAPHALCLVVITSTYVLYQFSGFGRLVLASYLLSIVIVFSWIKATYLFKIAVLAVSVPALIILTLNRIAFLAEEQGRTIEADEGIESVLGPFQSGAVVFQHSMDGLINATYGKSLLAPLVFWVPRDIWPEKPVGFGRAIVEITYPHLLASDVFSDSAPFLAEFIWDFGLFGSGLALVVVVLIVRADRRIAANLSSTIWNGTRRGPIFMTATLATLVSMFLSYIWGGAFTYVTRTFVPALALLSLHFLFSRSSSRRRALRSQSGEPRPDKRLRPRPATYERCSLRDSRFTETSTRATADAGKAIAHGD